MSIPWLNRLILAAALAVMPLQGMAETLSFLLCHGEAQTHAMHADSNSGHDTQPEGHHGNDASSDAAGGSVYHQCCNFTATALVAMTQTFSSPDFPVLAFTPDTLHDLFVPDRPQRPPLA